MKIIQENIIRDFKYMRNMPENEIEDYLYEITQSLSKEEAKELIELYLYIANKSGFSYGGPVFKNLLSFYNSIKEK